MDDLQKWVRSCLGKKRYNNYAFAIKLAKKLQTERGTELNVYPCSSCFGFHLTKQKVLGIVNTKSRA